VVIPEPIRDSKKMSEARREDAIDSIYSLSEYVVIAEVPVGLINRHTNIWGAWNEAMTAVLSECRCRWGGQIIVDGTRIVGGFPGVKYEAKADDHYREVSAASVVAKYVQVLAMEDVHEAWPFYEFDRHHGYGTAAHMRALREYGPCGAHRTGYKPVKKAMAEIEKDEPDRVRRLRQLDMEAVLDLQIIGG
jgi:ribonuclease HII